MEKSDEIKNKSGHKYYLRVYKNYFFAHNGGRFDFRFILKELMMLGKVDIEGTSSKINAMTLRNIHFIDFFLLIPQSLAQIAK